MSSLSTKYADKYTQFRTHLRRVWVNVLLHDEISLILEEKCADSAYSGRFVISGGESPFHGGQEDIRLTGINLLEFMKSSKGGGTEWTLEWSLVSAIGLFEAFINDIASIAYMSDPKKFLLRGTADAGEKENYKVLEIIINSSDRQEALEKCIEEKLRGVFYGNPIDVFFTDGKGEKAPKDGKLRLGTKDMHGTCGFEFLLYQEMLGRRNAIVHNAGRIDNKYIRDVPDAVGIKLNQNDKVKITKDYIFSAVHVLDTLAAAYILQVSHATGAMAPKNAK